MTKPTGRTRSTSGLPRGEAHHAAKLTADKVRAIRALAAAGISHAAIGREHGVSGRCIGAVVRRELWSHIE